MAPSARGQTEDTFVHHITQPTDWIRHLQWLEEILRSCGVNIPVLAPNAFIPGASVLIFPMGIHKRLVRRSIL